MEKPSFRETGIARKCLATLLPCALLRVGPWNIYNLTTHWWAGQAIEMTISGKVSSIRGLWLQIDDPASDELSETNSLEAEEGFIDRMSTCLRAV